MRVVPRSITPWFVLLATLLGFALRLPLNDVIPPRWDEGWSIAHASLSLGEVFVITAADVHPPLYYLLLGVWQRIIGIDLFAARYLSVLLSTTAIPLAYVAAVAWSRSRRVGVLAALFMAWLPLGVYYGAVVRMYALAPSFVLLAAFGALRFEIGDWRQVRDSISNRQSLIAFVVGALGAMLTLYHAVWALAAIAVYALVIAVIQRQRRIVRRLLIAIGLAVVLYLPWAAFAVPQFLGRASAEAATNIGQQFPLTYFLRQGMYDLTMSQQIGDLGLIVIGLIVIVGIVLALAQRKSILPVLLPMLMIGFTLIGVAFAARQWAFNARMLVCAVPALALLLAWAFDQMLSVSTNRWPLVGKLAAAVTALVLAGAYFTTSATFVYAKTLEVFDPYNPHTYHDHIVKLAQPNDVAFFNVLSPAGFYALDRQPNDPVWSYALTWDPVIEPRQRWEQRIAQAAGTHSRLWLVLYRGLAGKNGDLRGHMDSTYFPAHSEWGEEEVFYGLYGVPRGELRTVNVSGARWGDITLNDVRVGTSMQAGDIVPVALTWQASAAIPTNYKIFVHAAKPDGFVIAQHDAQPLNDLRPMTTWAAGEPVRDHHGLALPPDYRGELMLKLGLYDPDTGERLHTDDGRDAIELGKVIVE
jgi:4-amino-4-deoxy-L-arabinose transferase-like glycosyltransferase